MRTKYPLTQAQEEKFAKYVLNEVIDSFLPLPSDYMYLIKDEPDWITERERKAYDEKWGNTNELIRKAVNKVRMNKK